jgi:hypothetical protein
VTLRETRRFENGTLAATSQSAAGRSHASGTYETNATSLIWTVSCQPLTRSIPYTVTGSEVTFYEGNGSATRELTFERR